MQACLCVLSLSKGDRVLAAGRAGVQGKRPGPKPSSAEKAGTEPGRPGAEKPPSAEPLVQGPASDTQEGRPKTVFFSR